LRDEWKRKREKGELSDITDDVVFEVELIKQVEINIDYILMLVKKYHDTHCEDKEVLITIRKAIDASPELRSKKELIEAFREGEVKTVGTDIDKIMPPVSRFGGTNRAAKKKAVIDRLKDYFDKFYGVGGVAKFTKDSEEN